MKSCATYLLAVVVLTLWACDREDPIVIVDPPLENRVDFQNPVVGQENRYLSYRGECGQLESTGDTLFLRVVGLDGDSLVFQEEYTIGSPSYYPDAISYGAKWNANQLEIAADIRVQSALFYFYGSDVLRLKQDHDRKMTQQQCLVRDGGDSFTGDAIGRVPKFDVGVEEYRQKKIVSCVPVILELDGYLLYDEHHLFSSFTSSLTSCCGQPVPDEPVVQAFALIQD